MLFNFLLQLDINLFTAINNWPHNVFLNTLATWLHAGTRGGIIYAPLLLGLFLYKATRKNLLLMLIAIGLTDVVVDLILKPLAHRARPFSILLNVTVLPAVPTSYSFPSNETAVAFAIATISNLLFTNKWWKLLWIWAAVVGLDRIYMGQHYPSDVLFGAMIGMGLGWASYYASISMKKILLQNKV